MSLRVLYAALPHTRQTRCSNKLKFRLPPNTEASGQASRGIRCCACLGPTAEPDQKKLVERNQDPCLAPCCCTQPTPWPTWACSVAAAGRLWRMTRPAAPRAACLGFTAPAANLRGATSLGRRPCVMCGSMRLAWWLQGRRRRPPAPARTRAWRPRGPTAAAARRGCRPRRPRRSPASRRCRRRPHSRCLWRLRTMSFPRASSAPSTTARPPRRTTSSAAPAARRPPARSVGKMRHAGCMWSVGGGVRHCPVQDYTHAAVYWEAACYLVMSSLPAAPTARVGCKPSSMPCSV